MINSFNLRIIYVKFFKHRLYYNKQFCYCDIQIFIFGLEMSFLGNNYLNSDLKYPFWANFVQKMITACLTWNLVPRLIQINSIWWYCSFSLLWTGNTLFGQIWPQKSLLSIIECAKFNGDVQIFFFGLKISFLGKFGPKNQNCLLKDERWKLLTTS